MKVALVSSLTLYLLRQMGPVAPVFGALLTGETEVSGTYGVSTLHFESSDMHCLQLTTFGKDDEIELQVMLRHWQLGGDLRNLLALSLLCGTMCTAVLAICVSAAKKLGILLHASYW